MKAKDENMANKNKRKSKRKNTRAGTVLFITFLLLYVPSLLHWIYGNDISTDYIRNGKVENYINANAVIIRDEKLVLSPVNGVYIPDVGEGDKVAAYFKVASVLTESTRELIDELNKKNMEIIEARKEQSENIGVFSSDLQKLEADISRNVRKIAGIQLKNSLSDFSKIESDIEKLVMKKATIIGGTGAAGTYIESLLKERNNLEQKIKLTKTDIVLNESGIVSFLIDGYEEKFTVDGIQSLTPENVNVVTENPLPENNLEAKEGQPFCKLIRGMYYYMAASIDTDAAQYIKSNKQRIQLRINAIEKTVWADVFYVSKDYNGQSVVVFRLDSGMDDTIEIRKANIDIIVDSFEGLTVTINSLFNFNMAGTEADIMLARGNIASSKRVRIIGKNDVYAIIESPESDPGSVSLYDIYIRNPRNIREGQLIR